MNCFFLIEWNVLSFIVSPLIHPEVAQQPRHLQTFDELRELNMDSGERRHKTEW